MYTVHICYHRILLLPVSAERGNRSSIRCFLVNCIILPLEGSDNKALSSDLTGLNWTYSTKSL